MTDDPVARLPADAAARRLPEFIKTLRINRAARRESVYAADNVYALLDALDTAEARVRELEAERDEAYERAASKCEELQKAFATDEYALNQPQSSFGERYACGRCAEEIRNLAQEERHAKAD